MRWYVNGMGLLMLVLVGGALSCAAQAQALQPLEVVSSAKTLRTLVPLERFELIDIDTLFYIENEGLTRIQADLNGHKFKLVTDPEEVGQSANAFLIPAHGTITINIAALMIAGETNYIDLSSQGPLGSDAFILIGDLLVPGQNVAYEISGLTDLPAGFALLQSYPNPFQERVTITYDIPEERTTGVAVYLALYDVSGRKMQVLVDERRFPGSFSVIWEPVGMLASGHYFCRFVAEGYQKTIQLIHLP